MIVEELVTKLGLEVDSSALATLEKFRSAVSGGLSTMGIAAVGVAGAFVAMVHSVASFGDQIANTSEKLGVSAKSLQELKYAADQSDVSFDSLTTGLKFLSKNAAEAAAGSTEAMKSFAGVALRDGAGKLKTADQLLMSVTDRFVGIKDPIKQTDLAMKLFGRSGVDLVPMLKNGRDGIAAFVKDAYEMGVVLDDDVIVASDKFDRQLKRLTSSFVGLRNTFAGPFVQDFADGMEAVADGIRKTRPFFAALSLAFRDAGERMGGMIRIFRRGFDAFSNWFGDSALGRLLAQTKGFKVLEAVLIGLGVVFVAVAAQAIGAWLAAAAPFILLAALIGLIVDDIYNFIKGNDSLIGRVKKWADAIGDPDEHPMVRMLRKALALLMDVTSTKRWAEFKEAAGGAVDFVSEKIRVAFGGKVFRRDNPYAHGQLVPEDYTGQNEAPQGGVFGQGGLLDTLGFHRKGYEDNVKSGLITPLNGNGGPSGVHLQKPGYQSYNPNITLHVNTNGLTVEQATEVATKAVQNVLSDAMPATSGGEH